MAAAAESNVTPILNLKAKRDALPPSERKIVKRCVEAYEESLIDSVSELKSGLEVSGRQSSFTSTTTMKQAKGSNISISVAPRVRAAREALEFEVHITDDNQLELGWVDVEDDEDDQGGGGPDDDGFPNDGFGDD